MDIPISENFAAPAADPNATPLPFGPAEEKQKDPNATPIFREKNSSGSCKKEKQQNNAVIVIIIIVVIFLAVYAYMCSTKSMNVTNGAMVPEISGPGQLTFGAPQVNLNDLGNFHDLEIL